MLNRPDPETAADSEAHRRRRRLQLLNLLFGFIAVAGQVGQNVSLPLWIDSGRPDTCGNQSAHNVSLQDMPAPDEDALMMPMLLEDLGDAGNGSCTVGRSIDSYFVYTFACVSFVVIFGVLLIPIKLLSPSSLGSTELRFPQLALFLIGFFDALNGVLVVFASSGKRTLPTLQPILSNFMIPLTVAFRLILLRKAPSRLKGVAAAAVFLALVISILPTVIPSLGAETDGGASGAARFIWPIVFMVGFVPAAVMNVLQEKWLKHRLQEAGGNQLNLIFFLFSTSCYQLLTALVLFWVDIVPGYGNASSLAELGDSWKFGVTCFFGGAGCPPSSGVRGGMFIAMYSVSYIGGGLLMRYAEGATLLAVVSALVTPLGFLFWTFFQEDPFQFHVSTSSTTWFALGSLALMVPAILAYNWRGGQGEDSEQDLLIQQGGEGEDGAKVEFAY